MSDNFTRDKRENAAKEIVKNFMVTWCGRLKFEEKIKNLPKYLYRWGQKAIRTNEMRKDRRKFLGEIFQREHEIMLHYYKGKKKPQSKKTSAKLMTIKPYNVEKILDDYFYKVCYAFFKR